MACLSATWVSPVSSRTSRSAASARSSPGSTVPAGSWMPAFGCWKRELKPQRAGAGDESGDFGEKLFPHAILLLRQSTCTPGWQSTFSSLAPVLPPQVCCSGMTSPCQARLGL